MKKFLLPLLFFPVFSHAEVIRGTIPIMCTGMKEFVNTMAEFEELPLLTALSNRDFGNETVVPTALVVFVNAKTNTFTIAEKLEDKVCVIAIGENMKPFEDSVKDYQKSSL